MNKDFHSEQERQDYIKEVKQRIKDKEKEKRFLRERGFHQMARNLETKRF